MALAPGISDREVDVPAGVGSMLDGLGTRWPSRAVESVDRIADVDLPRLPRTSDDWAVVVPTRGLSREALAQCARDHAVYVMDRRTLHLLRVPGGNAHLVSDLLHTSWVVPGALLICARASEWMA